MFERQYDPATGDLRTVDASAGIELVGKRARDGDVEFEVRVGDRAYPLGAEYRYDRSEDPWTVSWTVMAISKELAEAVTSRGLDVCETIEEAIRTYASISGRKALVVTSVEIPPLKSKSR